MTTLPLTVLYLHTAFTHPAPLFQTVQQPQLSYAMLPHTVDLANANEECGHDQHTTGMPGW